MVHFDGVSRDGTQSMALAAARCKKNGSNVPKGSKVCGLLLQQNFRPFHFLPQPSGWSPAYDQARNPFPADPLLKVAGPKQFRLLYL